MKNSTNHSEVPKILAVDDRPENLIALDRLLKGLKIELIKAESGNEALMLTLHHDFALALIDIQMPEMDGYELAEHLRADENTRSIPFIFISAIYKDHINIFKGYETGAFSYITKPFEPEILLNKVRFFIDKYKQELALKQAHQKLEQHVTELHQANEELKSFSYSVSHDLRSPLRSITGFSQVLLEDYNESLDEEGQKLVSRIIHNSKKMSQLIDDILEFTKIGRQELYPRHINMKEMFSNVYEQLTENTADRKIEFNLAELQDAEGDKVLMERLITNLISNAIKYTSNKDQAVIDVYGYKEDDEYVYVVKDNGAGFDDLYKGKLFGVFQRLHKATEFNGTGVGLAIAQRIVLHHRGRIWAEGKVGEGAAFYFTIRLKD